MMIVNWKKTTSQIMVKLMTSHGNIFHARIQARVAQMSIFFFLIPHNVITPWCKKYELYFSKASLWCWGKIQRHWFSSALQNIFFFFLNNYKKYPEIYLCFYFFFVLWKIIFIASTLNIFKKKSTKKY